MAKLSAAPSPASGLVSPDRDAKLTSGSTILIQRSRFTHTPPSANCRIFSLFFPCFYPLQTLMPPAFLFSPSRSLASFNHPLLLPASRLCSSSEGPESLLIIPQRGRHLHKHAAKNKPFPWHLTRHEPKTFPLIYYLRMFSSPHLPK